MTWCGSAGELAAHVTDETRREIREACREHEAASREYLALSQEARDRQDAVEHLRHAIERIEVVGRCQPGLKDTIEGIQVILRGLRRRIEDPA